MNNLIKLATSIPVDEAVPMSKVAGHSLGGQTVGMLLGARLIDPHDPSAIPTSRAAILRARGSRNREIGNTSLEIVSTA